MNAKLCICVYILPTPNPVYYVLITPQTGRGESV